MSQRISSGPAAYQAATRPDIEMQPLLSVSTQENLANGRRSYRNNVWLGLELENVPRSDDHLAKIASGSIRNEVEGRIRSALRMRGQSFFLLNDEMKFLSLVFATDACAFVGDKKGQEHRKHIAAFASFGRKEKFEKLIDTFNQLYDVRNKIVHRGCSFGELGINAKDQLIEMDHILCSCIDAALQEKWSTKQEVTSAIDMRILGFKN